MSEVSLPLRYGMNPHQGDATLSVRAGNLPVAVLNGSPSLINVLDALNSWQLVRELRQALDTPSAASFKHVSPVGAAVAGRLGPSFRKAYAVDDLELSPLATAYARARGADRVSAYGDWAALSEPVDVSTARILRREVSDGVIAPGYHPEALGILCRKKRGRYVIIEADPAYQPSETEAREVFGLRLEQRRNDRPATLNDLRNVVTDKKELPYTAQRDMLVALAALKYTQSNSVCLAVDGQVIGMGAGQQSRIDCTRLAASKAETWRLRQHPAVLDLRLRKGMARPDRDNAIDQYLREDLTPEEETAMRSAFSAAPGRLSSEDKRRWIEGLGEVAMGSDGPIPFRDNVDRAQRTGVEFIAQPGGSMRDQEVIAACDHYGIAMVLTRTRLFHH